MVERQIRARGLRTPAVLEAMAAVPRHLFVDESYIAQAYEDHPLPIGHGQTISQPYMVALLADALGPGPGDRVLDIGTGSGYQCAVLGRMAPWVVSVELVGGLASSAACVLRRLGYANVACIVGDGSTCGFLRTHFDCIGVAAAAPEIPAVYCDLLAEGGRLVLPVGSPGLQQLLRVRRLGGRFIEESLTSCVYVPLRGAGAGGRSDRFD
ncbi:MAG: protein-L-isoaspartate(D-aspartate) O-methyltransferase [Candidatus Wallbacteria bacterium]|nr:protein-L-isoaspartate(D-aspartate) O-methyltransferase [Candidatus Wallbacteria bacterium]